MSRPERQFYEVRFMRDGRERSRMSTHLDIHLDEQKMHDLIIDAMRAESRSVNEIGKWRMDIYEPGRNRPVHTYGTTEEPGDKGKLGY